MKKLLAIILLLPSLGFAGWAFDGTNDYATMNTGTEIDFADGDWTVSGWIKPTNNAGTLVQYVLGNCASDPDAEFTMWVREASNSADPDALDGVINSDNAAGAAFDAGGSPGSSATWQHVLIERDGDDINLYLDNSLIDTKTDATFDTISLTYWQWGGRCDLNVDRFFTGNMAEWAKYDSLLTSTERQQLTDGRYPDSIATSPAWYVKMDGGDYTEEIVPLTVTNNGTTDASDHPTMTSGSNTSLRRRR